MVWGCRCEWVNGEGHGCQWRARWFGDAGVNGLMVKAMVAWRAKWFGDAGVNGLLVKAMVASGGLGGLGMQA